MNILVTGGAGFVGSNLVDKLIDQGNDVVVWDNLFTGKLENVNKKAIFNKVDISNEKSYKKHLADYKFDIIFHLAALARIQPSFNNPVETQNVNVMGTVNMLELAREHKARLVYSGSSTAYHDIYANPYSFSKFKGEEYCKLFNKIYGVSTAIARFFNVYGPRHISEGVYATVIAIWEKQKRENKHLTVNGDGSKRRDFTHIDDIVNGLIAISNQEWNCELFNLGSSKNYSLKEVAEMFEPVGIDYLANKPGEAQETLADISFSKEKLDWKPNGSIEKYIREFLKSL